jgi:hypothetical protein
MSSPTPEFQVFLSYGRPDAETVQTVHQMLRASGVTVWMDVENLRGGEEWRSAIKKALRSSQLVVIFLSRQIVAREGYLHEEILEALEVSRQKPLGRIFLIPVRIDNCPIHERLEQFHCVNLFAENGRARLLKEIEECRQAYRPPLSIGGGSGDAVEVPRWYRSPTTRTKRKHPAGCSC